MKNFVPIFVFAALLGSPLVHAEPFPLKLHKKMRGEVRDTLGIDRKDKDRDRHSRHDDRRVNVYYDSPRPYYYERPYSYDPYPYGSSLTIQRTVVERPVYRAVEVREELTLEQQVQLELSREGYYRGEIDGVVGPGTRAAIRRYQYEEDLPVTGRIDRELLRELDLI